MLSPLKPLLCRHDFYWSERHLSDRCRRCGKLQAGDALDVLNGRPLGEPLVVRSTVGPAPAGAALDPLPEFGLGGDIPGADAARRSARLPELARPSVKALKAQAAERRNGLPAALERLIQGVRPSREEAIDAVLAVIDDAHSADPVLFGPDAAAHFARLHEARGRIPN